MVVYKIKNKINGKMYIGQTVQRLEERWSKHISRRTCKAIGNAIEKYGKESFEVSIICRCNSYEEMNHREKYYIKLFKTLYPTGYNLTTGGNNGKHLEETKRKISEAQKGIKNHRFGKKNSDEMRQKMSESHKKNKRVFSPEERQKISERNSGKNHWIWGKTHKQESKDKIGKSLKEKWSKTPHHSKGIKLSAERKRQISKAQKGKKNSEKVIKRMRESGKKLGKPIKCLQNNTTYNSLAEASRELNIERSLIRKVLNKKQEQTKGYTFEWVSK